MALKMARRKFVPKKKQEFKKKVANIVRSVVSKDKQNKWFLRAAGVSGGDNRVDLLGQLGSNFEVTSQIRKITLSPIATISLPRQGRIGNKIKILGIKYCLRVRCDATSGAEGSNFVRITVVGTAAPAISSTGTLYYNDITEDYLDNVNGRTSVTAGDLTAYPLDMSLIKKVYLDKAVHANMQYNGVGVAQSDDRVPMIKGYIKINKIYTYKDVADASTFTPAENERICVVACSDSVASPHPILEGYYKIIFEDMD